MVFRLIRTVLLLTAGCLLWPGGQATATPLSAGQPFPAISLPAPASIEARTYLGLEEGATFTLDRVKGDLVLVELFNTLCIDCQRQAATFNLLYRLIEGDPVTRGRVKMLGIAIANTDKDIVAFKERFGLLYPAVSDPRFAAYRALGADVTPLTFFVLKDRQYPGGIVANYHRGLQDDLVMLFQYLKDLLTMVPADYLWNGSEEQDGGWIEPFLPPDRLGRRAARVLEQFGTVEEFEALDLPSRRNVFTAVVGGRRLFVEAVSRSAVCTLCHNVHFFCIFDRNGKVVGIEPLHLTKYGNQHWSPQDLAKLRQQAVGRSLAGGWEFNPEIDAISSATMTTAIIYDSLDQGRQLLDELHELGLR
ncbi:MAG: hypothetical protein C0616_15035 [Desulfuromonas sp.]|nr:MAG: hypothetical protein C0616_15035 [Desulfuromonas sp.]